MRPFPLCAVDLCVWEGGWGMSYLTNNDSFSFRNTFGYCLSFTNSPIVLRVLIYFIIVLNVILILPSLILGSLGMLCNQ